MLKKDIANLIKNKVEDVHVVIKETYGISYGVGYNLDITLKPGNIELLGRANQHSWAIPGKLNKDDYYTGKNDYKKDVLEYWETKDALDEYLMRLKKVELEYLLARIEDANEEY